MRTLHPHTHTQTSFAVYQKRIWFNNNPLGLFCFVLFCNIMQKNERKNGRFLCYANRKCYTQFRFTTIMPVVHLWKWKLIFFLFFLLWCVFERSIEDKNKKSKQSIDCFVQLFILSLSLCIYLFVSLLFDRHHSTQKTMYAFKMKRSITFHFGICSIGYNNTPTWTLSQRVKSIY